MSLNYLNWLNKRGSVKTIDNKNVELWEFNYDENNTAFISEWAKHFRNMYCDDTKIDCYRGTVYSRKDFLNNIKFPDINKAPGPSTRSGDFSELLISDLLEFMEHYWVPRTRYDKKVNKDMSTPGSDVVAIKIEDINIPSINDELLIFEVKAELASKYTSSKISRLQDAINDSNKDIFRTAVTLAAMKERFIDSNQFANMKKIERFQNPLDNKYKLSFGAAAVYSNTYYQETDILKTSTVNHTYNNALRLVIIKGNDLKKLVNLIYERAADEA